MQNICMDSLQEYCGTLIIEERPLSMLEIECVRNSIFLLYHGDITSFIFLVAEG
jgi:hypothetical protein